VLSVIFLVQETVMNLRQNFSCKFLVPVSVTCVAGLRSKQTCYNAEKLLSFVAPSGE